MYDEMHQELLSGFRFWFHAHTMVDGKTPADMPGLPLIGSVRPAGPSRTAAAAQR
jgi:hypothetical protein